MYCMCVYVCMSLHMYPNPPLTPPTSSAPPPRSMELGLAVPQVLPKHVQTLQTLQSGEEVHLLHGTTAKAKTASLSMHVS